jgi:hypothetical protein
MAGKSRCTTNSQHLSAWPRPQVTVVVGTYRNCRPVSADQLDGRGPEISGYKSRSLQSTRHSTISHCQGLAHAGLRMVLSNSPLLHHDTAVHTELSIYSSILLMAHHPTTSRIILHQILPSDNCIGGCDVRMTHAACTGPSVPSIKTRSPRQKVSVASIGAQGLT